MEKLRHKYRNVAKNGLEFRDTFVKTFIIHSRLNTFVMSGDALLCRSLATQEKMKKHFSIREQQCRCPFPSLDPLIREQQYGTG